ASSPSTSARTSSASSSQHSGPHWSHALCVAASRLAACTCPRYADSSRLPVGLYTSNVRIRSLLAIGVNGCEKVAAIVQTVRRRSSHGTSPLHLPDLLRFVGVVRGFVNVESPHANLPSRVSPRFGFCIHSLR